LVRRIDDGTKLFKRLHLEEPDLSNLKPTFNRMDPRRAEQELPKEACCFPKNFDPSFTDRIAWGKYNEDNHHDNQHEFFKLDFNSYKDHDLYWSDHTPVSATATAKGLRRGINEFIDAFGLGGGVYGANHKPKTPWNARKDVYGTYPNIQWSQRRGYTYYDEDPDYQWAKRAGEEDAIIT